MLRPQRSPTPHVHVELLAEGASANALRLPVGAPDDLEHLVVEDGRGAISSTIDAVTAEDVVPQAGGASGVMVKLGRASEGALRVRYDVRAVSDPHARPGLVVVAEDRFRGDGERLVLVPTGFEARRVEASVTIDGAAIEAPEVASSLGVGKTATREARGAALWRSTFLAGSLGKALFNDGIDRDDAAWLGYTAFDPRPAVAEIAQVRTALREFWKDGGEAEHALFFVSTKRPPGSYSLAGRASSLVVYLGPSEPWSAALRVGITQHLMHAWVGGEMIMAGPGAAGQPAAPGGAESIWFSDGFARYLAARLLSRLGLLSPSDVQAFVSGLLSVQATSARHDLGNAEAAAEARRNPMVRAQLVARGALYAARVDAALRAKSGGTRSLDEIMLGLMRNVRTSPGTPLSPDDLVAALAAELGPTERQAFVDQIIAGHDITLPSGALGKCFRARPGESISFSLGFDATATFESPGRVVVGLDPKGPATAAGLRPDDVIEDATFRDGDPSEPANLTIVRGDKKTTLRYLPRGRSGRGQRFERVRGIADASCAPVL